MNYEQFLMEHGILPIDIENGKWNRFLLQHERPQDEWRKKEVKRYIGELVGNYNGLYMYKNAQGEVLYIGKGKPLKNRLYSHYVESFEPVRGDTKDQRWHQFFPQHQGEMEIFWLALEGEQESQVVEKMLEQLLNPLFSLTKKRELTVKQKPTAKLSHDKRVSTHYQFYNYGEELVGKVQALLGPEFLPTYNQTGVTFFQGKQRILKLVNMAKGLKVEFNIAVSPVDGLTFYSKEQAKEKKLGTCQWIYQGKSLEVALALIEEARVQWALRR